MKFGARSGERVCPISAATVSRQPFIFEPGVHSGIIGGGVPARNIAKSVAVAFHDKRAEFLVRRALIAFGDGDDIPGLQVEK